MNEEHTVKIPQHRHCLHCGKAFTGEGFGERFCSQECLDAEGSVARKKIRKYILVMIVLWSVVIAAVVVTGFRS